MKPKKLEDIAKSFNSIDLFISSVSFEERTFSFFESIDKYIVKNKWFTYNENEAEFFDKNLATARVINDSELIPFSTDEPLISARNLLLSFDKLEKSENVVIDISTFTHEGLLILFKFINIYKEKIKNLFIVYTSAIEYSFNEAKNEEKWLSKGTKTIRSVLGYPGLLNPSNKNHLIILFGFEVERTSKLIETFEFNKVSIGIGPESDSINLDHYSINRQRHLDLLKLHPQAETFEFSLTDPFLAKEQIDLQISKYDDHNIVIAPLSNKLSTIAIGMAANDNPKIQICYIRAHEYNYKGYSKPSNEGYLIQIF